MLMRMEGNGIDEQNIVLKFTSPFKLTASASGFERPRDHNAELFLVTGEVLCKRFCCDHDFRAGDRGMHEIEISILFDRDTRMRDIHAGNIACYGNYIAALNVVRDSRDV